VIALCDIRGYFSRKSCHRRPSVATLTFLSVLQRPLPRNVRVKATLHTHICYVPLVLTFVKVPAATLASKSEKIMRAEVERLVEEIKQSVGLLRRHL